MRRDERGRRFTYWRPGSAPRSRVRRSSTHAGVGRGAAAWIVAILLVAAAWSPVSAQWDLSGSAGLRTTWADNVDYTSSCPAGTQPTACQSPDGDVANDLRLSGNAVHQGDRWSLNGSYSPAGTMYRDRTDLNHLSHMARLRSEWSRSQRTRVYVTEAFTYTPEQGASSDNLRTAAVLTRFSDRRSNRANAGLDHQLSVASRLTAEVDHGSQSFSDPELVDFAGMGLNLRWNHELSTRSGLELSARAMQNRFRRAEPRSPSTDPNDLVTVHQGSETYNVSAGGRIGMGTRLSARGLVGFDLLVPDERGRSPNSGSRVETALQWTGRAVNMETGYNRQISTGSGIFSDSWTQTLFSGTRVTFSRLLSGSLYANQSTSRGTGGQRSVETLAREGVANLDLDLSRAFIVSLFFSHNVQWRTDESSKTQRRGQSTDKVDDWRFGLALTARFN